MSRRENRARTQQIRRRIHASIQRQAMDGAPADAATVDEELKTIMAAKRNPLRTNREAAQDLAGASRFEGWLQLVAVPGASIISAVTCHFVFHASVAPTVGFASGLGAGVLMVLGTIALKEIGDIVRTWIRERHATKRLSAALKPAIGRRPGPGRPGSSRRGTDRLMPGRPGRDRNRTLESRYTRSAARRLRRAPGRRTGRPSGGRTSWTR
jgi:hypothetical protein